MCGWFSLPASDASATKRLVLDALGPRVGVRVEQEHLDRNLAVGERVAREVDAAGRAAADLAPDQRIVADLLLKLELQCAAALLPTCMSAYPLT